jgi:hypothetical protein
MATGNPALYCPRPPYLIREMPNGPLCSLSDYLPQTAEAAPGGNLI